MDELIEFQRLRIIALMDRVTELENLLSELTDENCPKDYKRVVKQLLNKNN